ncbi:hypothetical protein [Amycolatopsis sp. NPDC058986]|uniref:DUF7711 family protein n=1 Tax=unclassified Amycolatopsis TaxID=2618356 RepID=UPI00366E4A26
MKWERGIHHLNAVARTCAELVGSLMARYSLSVTQLWALGDILESPRELDYVTVALVVDLPVGDVPWLARPQGAEHWEQMTRVAKIPVRTLWRSAHAPVWNHFVDRPALVWDTETGIAEDTLATLRAGRGHDVRLPAPSPEELRTRLDDELAVSLRALRERTREYDDRRWKPGKLTGISDALWEASNGYLDLLDARGA